MSRRAVPTQVDIARALRAVKQAGVRCAVEIDTIAGTIRLIPDGQKAETPAISKSRLPDAPLVF